MEVTTGTVGDTTQLGTLLESLDDIESVSGDTGYLSHRNCELVEAKGATPYLKPRRHSPEKPIGPPAWKRMIRSYRQNRPGWMKTVPHAINGRDSLLSNQTNPRPPTHIHQKRPPETRTHDQSNRLQHHSPNQKHPKRSIETEPFFPCFGETSSKNHTRF